MQDKLTKTGTVALMALMGFSAFVTAQTMRKLPNEPVKRGPIVTKTTVQLGCATKAKEMNESITVTNPTAQTVKKGTTISYTIHTQKGSFKLASDLAPNASLVQASVPYQGNQGCKAWY
jgi:hypothetical protein